MAEFDVLWEPTEEVETIVRNTVARLAKSMPAARTQFDDLYQEGLLAAAKALSQYDPSKGKLTTYLFPRVRGAAIDYLRSTWWFGNAAFRRSAVQVHQFARRDKY